jgi:hypothetical protein
MSSGDSGTVPSSRGLGHHPLKVETRVRTPLGLQERPGQWLLFGWRPRDLEFENPTNSGLPKSVRRIIAGQGADLGRNSESGKPNNSIGTIRHRMGLSATEVTTLGHRI